VIMGFRHTQSTNRRGFKIDLNQYGRLVSHDPGIVAGGNGNYLRSRKALHATIRVLNVDAAASEEAHMRVHT